jgi:TrpR-related protein YerC/YecD
MRRGKRDDSLYDGVLSLRTREECEAFFTDLLSEAELQSMFVRFEIAQRLTTGLTQHEIASSGLASPATIGRVKKSLDGKHSAGGFRLVLQRMREPMKVTKLSRRSRANAEDHTA